MKDKKVLVWVLCGLICVMAVGYAAFSAQLKINGTASIESNWSVVFTKIEEISKTSGVTITNTPTASGTTATFNVDFKSPGDTIEYKVTVENKGTLNAVIDGITIAKQENKPIQFEVSNISKGDKLAKGASATFNIKIKYDSSITTQPDASDKNGVLSIHINYVQDMGQVIPADKTYSAGDEVYFNPVTNVSCTKGASGCQSWYVLKNNGETLDLLSNFYAVTDACLSEFSLNSLNWTVTKRIPTYSDIHVANGNSTTNLPTWLSGDYFVDEGPSVVNNNAISMEPSKMTKTKKEYDIVPIAACPDNSYGVTGNQLELVRGFSNIKLVITISKDKL